ncbi:MAG: hypothetical protein WBN68_06870, partial [Sedimenticolaceae bacterium]
RRRRFTEDNFHGIRWCCLAIQRQAVVPSRLFEVSGAKWPAVNGMEWQDSDGVDHIWRNAAIVRSKDDHNPMREGTGR